MLGLGIPNLVFLGCYIWGMVSQKRLPFTIALGAAAVCLAGDLFVLIRVGIAAWPVISALLWTWISYSLMQRLGYVK